MNQTNQNHTDSPVTKVGAVLLRAVNGAFEVLIVKPRAKKLGEQAPMGLVRGTRKYRDAAGQWVDANREGDQLSGVEWEPLFQTFLSETEEEAGLQSHLLLQQEIYEMGTHVFASAKKAPYPIHWFIALLDRPAQQAILSAELQDSLKAEFVSLPQLEALAAIPIDDVARERVSPGYLDVVQAAIAGLKAQHFARVKN